jgi:hypothetical protein
MFWRSKTTRTAGGIAQAVEHLLSKEKHRDQFPEMQGEKKSVFKER